MYKNIIFDLGGVMVSFKPHDFLMDLFMDAKTEQAVYDLTFGSEEWQSLDRGNLTRKLANEQMLVNAKHAGYAFEAQEVLDTWITIVHRKARMYRLVNDLQKAGYPVYYLSNMAPDVFAHLNDHNMLPTFDGGVVSYEVRCNKPEAPIYQALIEKYNLDPTESVFIDDTKANIVAANELGFQGILMPSKISLLLQELHALDIYAHK